MRTQQYNCLILVEAALWLKNVAKIPPHLPDEDTGQEEEKAAADAVATTARQAYAGT